MMARDMFHINDKILPYLLGHSHATRILANEILEFYTDEGEQPILLELRHTH